MRILIVGSKALTTRDELITSSVFSVEDVLDVHTVPEGTPPYDMVIGDNCVRVYPNTIQFLRPFVKKAEEAAAAKAKASGEPAPEKPKKKVTKKKVDSPEIKISTEIKIVPPEEVGKEAKEFGPPSAEIDLVNKAIADMSKMTDKTITDALKGGKSVIWDAPIFMAAAKAEHK